ncbi:alcohol dehydrogenase catalytic domain-containing protein [Mumia zhuanghuii]|uniref:Alcohol dehydrogenase catalytic domain-containing protein n=2 Tax=Mumia TaxID=1546255 RepID=A0ABW1QLZ4_9ACTN|nr:MULTISPECIES: alcohol dehydrogenase catalytic domain-containing protein [Mumia]KAA1425157.1 alcohol dehydrogenase catalytic domain-containing protein [Mumia zhuanghuii]
MRTTVLLHRSDEPAALVDAELDALRPDEVLVRVEATGLCHTDLVTLAGLRGAPAVLGHEGCGLVERVGEAVTDLVPGDRVVISFRFCGRCAQCDAGHPAYCEHAAHLNSSGRRPDGTPTVTVDGQPVFASFFGQSSFASHAIAPAQSCVRVAADVPAHVAAPLGCGFLTGAGAVLNTLAPTAGDRLLVVGAGGVGAAAAATALAVGVEVVVIDPMEQRRALAQSLGATAYAGLEDQLPSITHALDTTGRADVIAATLKRLSPRGVLALVGLGKVLGEIDLRDVMLRGLQLRGCVEGDAVPAVTIPRLVALYREGLLPLDRLVATFTLDEFDAALKAQRDGVAAKVVLLPPA